MKTLNPVEKEKTKKSDTVNKFIFTDLLLFETIIKEAKNLPKTYKKINQKLIDSKDNDEFYSNYAELVSYILNDKEAKAATNKTKIFLDLEHDYNCEHANHYILSLLGAENPKMFSDTEIYLNFYLVQNWINKIKNKKSIKLEDFEIKLLSEIIEGWSYEQIVNHEIENINSVEIINDYVNKLFPKKFGFKNFLEVLGLLFYLTDNYISYEYDDIIYNEIKKFLT